MTYSTIQTMAKRLIKVFFGGTTPCFKILQDAKEKGGLVYQTLNCILQPVFSVDAGLDEIEK